MQDDHILSVSALTGAIKDNLEGAFPFVWVRGQVVNLSRPGSGHVYFSLRDEGSSLAAVWFKGNQKAGERFDPLTGEVYEEGPRPSLALSLENGQEIVCAGRIAVYGARGVYQLVVELAQESGFGRLHEEFERLRNRLDALGYFAAERKRPLPAHPARVALITAPGGAAIHDFLRVAENRGLGATVRVYPTPVQGEAAPPVIMAAMRRIADEGWAEVIVLIRGGGSIEDLWAFNHEGLAGLVFASPAPVLAGIGHEVDFTLADMTADLRAATPSHAAQLLWPAREELRGQWRALAESLEQAGDRVFARSQTRLDALARELEWRSPQRLISGWHERLIAGVRLLRGSGRLFWEREQARLRALSGKLENGPDPLPARTARLAELERRLAASGPSGMERRSAVLETMAAALRRMPGPLLDRAGHSLDRAGLRLEAVNPLAPLERGYALAFKADGHIVKKTGDAAPGETLRLMVSDGGIRVRVEDIEA